MYQNQVSEGDMGAFLEIKLVFGQLRMRLKFTKESVVSFTIGENLNDRYIYLNYNLNQKSHTGQSRRRLNPNFCNTHGS